MAALITKKEVAPLLKRVATASGSFDENNLMEAFEAAQEIYGNEQHWTGVSILEHVVGVLETLAPFEPDEDAIIACLLHDALQTGNITVSELEERFGPNVRSLISGVHLLSHVTLQGRRGTIEDLRLMLMSVSDDVRTVLIILCDRCHALEFLDIMPPEDAKRVCQDVLQIFAPVAARLGIYAIKHKLEGRAFPVLYPHDAERVREQLDQVHEEYPTFLDRASQELKDFMSDQGMEVEVEAREKQLYSIFLKMDKKTVTHVKDLYDLFAIRVIVPSSEDCYQVLGLLHQIGRPVANRFKDYIGFPKPNGYQSLHTTLMQFSNMSDDVFVEIQIRTPDMHREAKYGVAAHWSYKEYGATMKAMENVQFQSLLASQQEVGDERGSKLVDHIFVLTPKGGIVELPEGATPLDFAFQVHTDLGLTYCAARVNGSVVSSNYQLENGDVVEIVKKSTPQASPEWMQHLKMASSRSKLKRYLYSQNRPEYIARGRELVNAELKKHRLPPLDTDLSLLRVCDGVALSKNQREDILVKIGQDSEKASSLLPRIGLLSNKFGQKEKSKEKVEETFPERETPPVMVEGGLRMPVRYAQCCEPQEWPHGSIQGCINRSGEVMIHRNECSMLRQANKDRLINVQWK